MLSITELAPHKSKSLINCTPSGEVETSSTVSNKHTTASLAVVAAIAFLDILAVITSANNTD